MSSLIALIRADAVLDAPAVPQSWQRQVESNGWTSVYPLGKADGRFFSARLILRQAANPTRALFVCTGPAAMLDRLATAIAADALPWTKTWATLAALRTDGARSRRPSRRRGPTTGRVCSSAASPATRRTRRSTAHRSARSSRSARAWPAQQQRTQRPDRRSTPRRPTA